MAASEVIGEDSGMPSIDAIDGIDVKDATRFRKNGVRTTEALLRKAQTRRGRKDLAVATGLTEKQLFKWVNRADLMRVKGIGAEYADLLEAVGVTDLKDLRTRNASALTKRLLSLNARKQLVRRLPTEGMVDGWIAEAKGLRSLVRH